MNASAVVAVIAGGLFTSAVVYFASARVPRWRRMGGESFLPDFARTINTADKVQPALLAVTLAATILLASSADGAERVLAWAAVTGFAFVMIASLIFLVPLQRRMIKTGGDSAASLDAMKSKWSRGHIGRTVLAIVSFALLVLAVVL